MSIANSTNNESYKHTGRIESPDCELLQRLLHPNGVRVYSYYGNDGGGGGGLVVEDKTRQIILILNIFSTSLHDCH